MKIFYSPRPIKIKLWVAILVLFGALISIAHAEDLLVPLAKFDNDSQKLSNDSVLEFWGYHQYDGSQNYENTLKIRFYTPLNAGDWRGRFRLDTSVVSNYNSATSQSSSSQYSGGQTLITVWGQDGTFLKSLGALVGGRVVLPNGNSNQWAFGPQLNWTFTPQVDSLLHVTDFSPLLRYMYGICAGNSNCTGNMNQTPLSRSLQIFPTIGFELGPATMLRFWDENGAVYNSAGGGWFLPIDAMLTHRLGSNFVVAIGASKQLVQTFQQYNWMTYGKVSWNF